MLAQTAMSVVFVLRKKIT